MPYETYVDYDSGNASLPIGYADATIGPGTKVCLDALDPNCYGGALPAGALAAGSLLTNLVNETAEITVDSVAFPALAAAGFQFNSTGQRLLLPASVRMPSTATDFFFGAWVKPAAQALTASGQFASPFAHATGTTAATQGWLCQHSYDIPTTYVFGSAGQYASLTGVAVNTVAFIGARVVIDQSAQKISIYTYKDGVAGGQVVAAALPVGGFPAVGGTACLGTSALYPAVGWRGQIGRFVFQDLGAAGAKTFAQFMSDEIKQGAGPRFA